MDLWGFVRQGFKLPEGFRGEAFKGWETRKESDDDDVDGDVGGSGDDERRKRDGIREEEEDDNKEGVSFYDGSGSKKVPCTLYIELRI